MDEVVVSNWIFLFLMHKTSHFSALKAICHFFSHSCSLSRSCWSSLQSFLLIFLYTRLSFANSLTVYVYLLACLFLSSIDSSSVRRTASQRWLLWYIYALSPLLKANLTSLKITGSCMRSGNHPHTFIQFKITRRYVQIKNTPSPYVYVSICVELFKQV